MSKQKQTDQELAYARAYEIAVPLAVAFPDVESITFEIVGKHKENKKDVIGRKWTTAPSDLAMFYQSCANLPCFGANTGLDYRAQIRDILRSHRVEATFHVECGGQYSKWHSGKCEDYLDIRASVRYKSI